MFNALINIMSNVDKDNGCVASNYDHGQISKSNYKMNQTQRINLKLPNFWFKGTF